MRIRTFCKIDTLAYIFFNEFPLSDPGFLNQRQDWTVPKDTLSWPFGCCLSSGHKSVQVIQIVTTKEHWRCSTKNRQPKSNKVTLELYIFLNLNLKDIY